MCVTERHKRFHRLKMSHNVLTNKPTCCTQIVSTACLFLAGKVEETPKALKEVVRVGYLVRHKHDYEQALKRINQQVRPRCLLSSFHENPQTVSSSSLILLE